MTNISDIDDKIAQLEAQKRDLITETKKTAIKKVQLAIDELNSLGFNYKLSGGDSIGGKRRTGIRAEVLAMVSAQPHGIARSSIIKEMKADDDKKAQQSISNALAALKKAGTIVANDGVYSTK